MNENESKTSVGKKRITNQGRRNGMSELAGPKIHNCLLRN